MMELSALHGYGKELEERLRLKTFPLAVKFVEKEEDIPEGAKRPKRDMGHHLSACQGFSISRREGVLLAQLKEDMWCPEPAIGYGLGEPPEYFLEGHNRFPLDVETLEAGSNYAREFPRLKVGRYVGVLSAPLTAATFEPDLVVIYCDSVQLSLLLLGREYKEGYSLKCQLSSHAACVYALVPAIQEGECQVAVPCRGDRYVAKAGDEEMIFTVPTARLEDLVAGLRHVESYGSKLPREYELSPEPVMPEGYEKIARMMGYIKPG